MVEISEPSLHECPGFDDQSSDLADPVGVPEGSTFGRSRIVSDCINGFFHSQERRCLLVVMGEGAVLIGISNQDIALPGQ